MTILAPFVETKQTGGSRTGGLGRGHEPACKDRTGVDEAGGRQGSNVEVDPCGQRDHGF